MDTEHIQRFQYILKYTPPRLFKLLFKNLNQLTINKIPEERMKIKKAVTARSIFIICQRFNGRL
jgi:hypothetical protein